MSLSLLIEQESLSLWDERNFSSAHQFVEINTHHNITMKREFMYLEGVIEAINANTLEEKIIVKRCLIMQFKASKSKEKLIQALFDLMEKDMHLLQKRYKISNCYYV